MTQSRLTVELLEDRCVPSAAFWGNPWPDAQHLTLSFAPDGTSVNHLTSELYQSLDQVNDTADWQIEILRAFQTWAIYGNINIGLVPDQGLPFGIAGRPQGDPRFGDIRLAGYEMSPEVFALASPYDPLAGTWAGDVRLNTAYLFGVGGAGDFDLYTIMLHEAAHVYGLDHSDDPASAVFEHYLGARTTGLTADDIFRLQELYGSRQPDQYEGRRGNDTFGRATALNLISNPNGSLGIRVDADITTLNDVDFFKFQAPLNLGGFNIRLNVSGMSLLNAKMTVYDSSGKAIGSAVSTDPLKNDLEVRISRYSPLATYYVKVESATSDVFGIGSYQLEVESIPAVSSLFRTIQRTVTNVTTLLNNDLHTNDTFLTASLLPPLFTETSSRFTYAYKASISNSRDVDFYYIQAPQRADLPVMTVMVWGLENDGLLPWVQVYDAKRNEIQTEVLVNEDGIVVLQIPDAVPGAHYYVKVQAADSKGPNNTGNYFLGIDFSQQHVSLTDMAEGRLDAGHSEQSQTVVVQQTQFFHFTLSATTGSNSAARVRMEIVDHSGQVVMSLTANNGAPAVSGKAYLPKGTYTLRFVADGLSGSAVLKYTLRGNRLDDPIGPQPDDPTHDPAGSSSPPPSSPSSSTSMSAPPPDDGTSSPDGSTQPPPSDSSSSPSKEDDDYQWWYDDDKESEPSPTSDSSDAPHWMEPEDPYDDPYMTW